MALEHTLEEGHILEVDHSLEADSSLLASFFRLVNARNAQRAPFICLVALASMIDKYLSISFLATFFAFKPFLAIGNK